MAYYYLTNDAENDLRKIIEYTLSEWGIEQVLEYQESLNRA